MTPTSRPQRTPPIRRGTTPLARGPPAPTHGAGWVTNPPHHGGGPTPVQRAMGHPRAPGLDPSLGAAEAPWGRGARGPSWSWSSWSRFSSASVCHSEWPSECNAAGRPLQEARRHRGLARGRSGCTTILTPTHVREARVRPDSAEQGRRVPPFCAAPLRIAVTLSRAAAPRNGTPRNRSLRWT